MEDRERIGQFIQAFQRDSESFLEGIREEAQKEAVPIIRDETAALLRVCLEMKKPKSILELGTAVGYSGLFMLHSLRGSAKELERRRRILRKAPIPRLSASWKVMGERFLTGSEKRRKNSILSFWMRRRHSIPYGYRRF